MDKAKGIKFQKNIEFPHYWLDEIVYRVKLYEKQERISVLMKENSPSKVEEGNSDIKEYVIQ